MLFRIFQRQRQRQPEAGMEEEKMNQDISTEKELKSEAEEADARSSEEKEEMTEETGPSEEEGSEAVSHEENVGEAPEEDDSAAEPESESEKDEEEEGAPDGIVGKEAVSDEEKKTSRFFGLGKKKDKRDEQIEELTDQVRRQMAEFDNFRKRTDKEKAQMFDMGARDVIEKVLPVVDSFERGLDTVEETDESPFVEGMRKVYKQLMTVLEGLDVKPIEAVGQPFDPAFHNAVMHCEDEEAGENTVVQEFQKGYLYKDAVVRHSMVKVAN